MRYPAIAILACLALSQHILAQSSGQLRLLLEPAGTTSYLLDGKHRMTQRELSLLEGPHRFVFWAPERRMLDTTIVVMPDRVTDVRIALRYADAYIAYRDDLRRYERSKGFITHVPTGVAAGAVVWGAWSMVRWAKADQALGDARQAYDDSADPAAITTLKRTTIPEAERDFRSARTQVIAASGVLSLAAGAMWYVRARARDRRPPTYDDQERIRFEGLTGWHTVPGSTGWLATCSIPIR